MHLGITYWERRDSTDRNDFANAALGVCRAMRQREGINDCRFFWRDSDTIMILTEAASKEAYDRRPGTEAFVAMFALSDAARRTASDDFLSPTEGMNAYRDAGRT
jgi:hypothetical protein